MLVFVVVGRSTLPCSLVRCNVYMDESDLQGSSILINNALEQRILGGRSAAGSRYMHGQAG